MKEGFMQEMGLEEQVGVHSLRVGKGHSDLGQKEKVGPRLQLACGGKACTLLFRSCSARYAVPIESGASHFHLLDSA